MFSGVCVVGRGGEAQLVQNGSRCAGLLPRGVLSSVAAAASRGVRTRTLRGSASHGGYSRLYRGSSLPLQRAVRFAGRFGGAVGAPARIRTVAAASSAPVNKVGLPGPAVHSEGRVRTSARDGRLLTAVSRRIQLHMASSSREARQESVPQLVSGPQLHPSPNFLKELNLPYAETPTAVRLVAAKVALPEVLSSVDLLTALPGNTAATWAAPSAAVLRDAADVPAVLPAPHVFASREQWVLLLRRLLAVNMIDVATEKPLCINGAFGVRKDADSIRLIIDARACNSFFKPPDNPLLPTPAEVARLSLPAGKRMLLAKSDLSNCYHSLRVPLWLRRYFGLPSVTAGELGLQGYDPDTVLWPTCSTLPMGFAPAVFLAQQCTLRLMVDSGLRFRDLVLPGNSDFGLDRVRCLVYLDDAVWLGLEEHRQQMLLLQAQYILAGTARGWLFSAKKLSLPAYRGDVLGIGLDGINGTFGLQARKMDLIIAETERLLRFDNVHVKSLHSLVGSLVWAMLAFRPALSAFRQTFIWLFKHANSTAQFASLGPAVARELAVAAGILPLCRTDLRSPFFANVIATDASDFGFGVVACSPRPRTVLAAAERFGAASLPGQDGVYQMHPAIDEILRERWRKIVSSPVLIPGHISSLEATAATLGLRWALSSPAAVGRRVLFFNDNAAVTCSLTKGRSSSFRLNKNLARFAAFCLAAGSAPTVVWIPTTANPADSASRLR